MMEERIEEHFSREANLMEKVHGMAEKIEKSAFEMVKLTFPERHGRKDSKKNRVQEHVNQIVI